VSKVVLAVTAAHSGFIKRAQEILAERATPEQIAVCDRLWSGTIETVEQHAHFYEVMGPLYAVHHNPKGAAAGRNRGILTPEPLNRAFGPNGFLRRYDLRPELARITAPTLILAGARDWICAPEFSEEIHRLIPGSLLRIFPNASHSLRVDVPEQFCQTVINFVEGRPIDG